MDSYKALCEICGISFTFRKDLYRHLRVFHDMDVNLDKDKETCDLCDKKFSTIAALERHKKTHRPAPQKLSCTECDDFICRTREELRGHLECEHGISMETTELEFDSMEQFLQWKLKMEGDAKVFFTKRTGERMVDSEKSRLYYICHRSRSAVKSGFGKRLRASNKIDQTCPASLIVTKMPSGKISVKFYMTHTGHNFSVGPLHFAHADRAMVTGQIVLEPKSTYDVTVMEDSGTKWQQEVQHFTPGPVIVTVEEVDAMSWQQELPHSTPDFCGNICEKCGTSFTLRTDLYRHLRTFHNMDVNLSKGKETCDLHDNKFLTIASLDHHKDMHIPAPQKLSCTECGVFICHTREELRDHLEREHGISMETKELEFDTMEQFLQWKLKMEGDEKVFFTKRTDEGMVDSKRSCLCYICHHSRSAMTSSFGKRLRASNKIEQTCPASLIVTKMPSGKISVKFYMTHTGHNLSVGPLHFTHADKTVVTGQPVHGPNNTDGITVLEDATELWPKDLQQHRLPGPVSVTVELNSGMPWQQDHQDFTPGVNTKQGVAVEHSYAMRWHLA
ncbi:uncharacterized protein LOC126281631 isoform X1 [Schistocerca gregaria]|uniref:uncharacterized protein LOC126281631 isoform X1 n=2 Tax=Schistocerca gregaria TaxID=7010 RepID=UPI00211DB815|nr:uncharacterized protein LOC126281631 isoform X1 [Schistocerca gregaria]XP_049836713.1 uncharacterized protein LOC126281631 isoform X1 [Schistocerca gregaria]XP_049836714.1 uncharacterized protein LOC126281631 isoform X1 [Schistocerca gregaria]XP_049836715.1 uncharacterized protein LOC126281631 isoform X1 [Schistocerca gregaria]XP_049836716.1 uncharacterized protein LOC126281631 isoform X1 [Schistocerca gregaria]